MANDSEKHEDRGGGGRLRVVAPRPAMGGPPGPAHRRTPRGGDHLGAARRPSGGCRPIRRTSTRPETPRRRPTRRWPPPWAATPTWRADHGGRGPPGAHPAAGVTGCRSVGGRQSGARRVRRHADRVGVPAPGVDGPLPGARLARRRPASERASRRRPADDRSAWRVPAGTEGHSRRLRSGLDGRRPGRPRGHRSRPARILQSRLRELQGRLWAEGRRSLLVVLQGLDAAGKDGTVKHVFSGVNPQGARVASFKEPTARGAGPRFSVAGPPPGAAGGRDRRSSTGRTTRTSWWPGSTNWWRRRCGGPATATSTPSSACSSTAGTTIVKFFLHISYEEQGKRLQDRLDDPTSAGSPRRRTSPNASTGTQYTAAYTDAAREDVDGGGPVVRHPRRPQVVSATGS